MDTFPGGKHFDLEISDQRLPQASEIGGVEWLVGDILDDIEAGHRAGCQTVLVLAGTETVWKLAPVRMPDWMAIDVAHAARLIVAETHRIPAPILESGGRHAVG